MPGKRRSTAKDCASPQRHPKLFCGLTCKSEDSWVRSFVDKVALVRTLVDFYCPEAGLVIELDGAPHFGPNAGEYDRQRTDYLERAGLRVIRFENQNVRDNIELVLESVKQSLQPV